MFKKQKYGVYLLHFKYITNGSIQKSDSIWTTWVTPKLLLFFCLFGGRKNGKIVTRLFYYVQLESPNILFFVCFYKAISKTIVLCMSIYNLFYLFIYLRYILQLLMHEWLIHYVLYAGLNFAVIASFFLIKFLLLLKYGQKWFKMDSA